MSRPAREKKRRRRVLVVHHLLTQTDARRPAGQVVRHRLHRQPSGVGGETAGREMVETHAVLEVADGGSRSRRGAGLTPPAVYRGNLTPPVHQTEVYPREWGNLPHIEKAPRKLRSTPALRVRGPTVAGGVRALDSVYPRECGGTRPLPSRKLRSIPARRRSGRRRLANSR